MVRGCQRKIYVVKNPESPLFEEAYFILKQNLPRKTEVSPNEMAEEAKRIVKDVCGLAPLYPKTGNIFHNRLLAFVLGAAASSALIGSVALTLAFL